MLRCEISWHCIVRPWFGALCKWNAARLSFRCLPNLSFHRSNSFHFIAIHFTGTFLQGYAFVQFTSPFDARSACLGEDAKSLCGQTLDVNMVSEPKAHISKVKGQEIQIKRQYWRWRYVKVKAQKRQKEKGEAGGAVLSYYMAAAGEYSHVI